jgi:hypothetical protein
LSREIDAFRQKIDSSQVLRLRAEFTKRSQPSRVSATNIKYAPLCQRSSISAPEQSDETPFELIRLENVSAIERRIT